LGNALTGRLRPKLIVLCRVSDSTRQNRASQSELTIQPNEFIQPDYTITYIADDGRRLAVGRIFRANAGARVRFRESKGGADDKRTLEISLRSERTRQQGGMANVRR
jgi:hypothetical protein